MTGLNFVGGLTLATSGSGSGLNQLTGDVTAGPGTGSQAATLATVNSNVGSFTNANITVNGKGLVTAAANGAASAVTQIASSSPTGTNAVTFSAIAGTYSTLQIVIYGRSTKAGAGGDSMSLTFNGDTGTNYAYQESYGNGNSAGGASAAATTAGFAGQLPTAGDAANYPGSWNLMIPRYADTTFYKNAISFGGFVFAATVSGNLYTSNTSSWWANTAAITSVTLTLASGNWVTGSVLTLYGIT